MTGDDITSAVLDLTAVPDVLLDVVQLVKVLEDAATLPDGHTVDLADLLDLAAGALGWYAGNVVRRPYVMDVC